MDLGTTHNTQNSILMNLIANKRRTSILALTSCVGLLVGISTASEISEKSMPTQSATATNTQQRLTVRVNDVELFKKLMTGIESKISGVELGNSIDPKGEVFVVHTQSRTVANQVRKILSQTSVVQSIVFDQADFRQSIHEIQSLAGMNSRLSPVREGAARGSTNGAGTSIGIEPVEGPGFGGTLDPSFQNGSMWHLAANNIPTSIYDTLGLTGAGVVVGVPARGLNVRLDKDHPDLFNNYSLELSQEFDPNAFPNPDTITTGWAAIVGGERNNGVAAFGIAPGSTLSTFRWNTNLELVEFQAYEWLNQDVDIKFYENNLEYVDPQGGYNAGVANNFVTGALENSIRFGRRGKGVVNIFGTGRKPLGSNIFLPDPYNFLPIPGFTSFSPVDQWASGNTYADGLTNGWTSGPYYTTGNTNNYAPALDRRSMIINTIAEDGNYDIYAAQGTSIFASVYGGTNNEDQSGSQAVSGRGIATSFPTVNGTVGLLPTSAADAPFDATTTGPAITSGIVALMLEANPDLSVRDIQHIFFESIQESTMTSDEKWPNYDLARTYYFPDPNASPRGFWQLNAGLYSGGVVTNQAIRHSDNYGFGIIDAELAIQKAATYQGAPLLTLLDSGTVGQIAGGDGTELDIAIATPTFLIGAEPDGALGINGSAGLVTTGPGGQGFDICVRQNIVIESIIIEVTVEGNSSNDLYMTLTSPNGTRSNLALPTSLNQFGTSFDENFLDDEADIAPFVTIGTTTYALFKQPYLTWKHWGEMSGGTWRFRITDFGVDESGPEGIPADPDLGGDPGADMVVALGELGVPASEFRDESTFVAYRIRFYGQDIGEEIFPACNPFATSCPAYLDGNGVVNVLDLQIYIEWYTSGNALADIDGDGNITFADLSAYRAIWVPGFCMGGGDPFGGGRPRPGGSDANGGDNDPVVRPI
ncbi:MAG: proprotein convertase P-domain-containing protein [Phycisphaerales bacterium]|nr:proprotein convertase P-domain-containing protein [Phycisphaerales bacterium]